MHDWRLAVAAACVCFVASLAAFRLYPIARAAAGAGQFVWLALTATAAGLGIWITHFIAMMAYHPAVQTGYEPLGTALSLVLAIPVSAASFGLGARRLRHGDLLVGVLLGLGAAVVHYTGMQAFRMQGMVMWNGGYVVASLLLGVLVAGAATVVAGECRDLKAQAKGAALFTVAVCVVHFTGMGAMTVHPDASVVIPVQMVAKSSLGTGMGLLAGVVVCAVLGALIIDLRNQKASADRMRDAVEAIPQAMAIFDAEDRCVIWNAGYAALNREVAHRLEPGVSFRALLEAGLSEGHYPEARGQEEAWLEARMKARREAPATVVQHTSDDRWLRIEDRPMANGGRVSVVDDFTDLKRDAIALAQARDEAQGANRAKSEFLANMSHEIRTPLNGVVGVADVLANTELSDPQREMVEMVRASAVQLERLLSDVLDLARIESGKVEIRPEPFNLAEAGRMTAALYEPTARVKGVALAVDIAPEADALVLGDMVRIKQILGNLVSNAVKFTTEGEVRLSIRRTGGWWRCEVKDSGIGFDPEQKERLFGRFQQEDGSVTRRFGGTGLGLAICRQLSELMGAELDCDSRPGEGATFRLLLDLPVCERAAPAIAEPIARDAETPPDATLRVLLADDHPTNRKVVELILAQAGVDLLAVEDGSQALDAVRTGTFDVILMDMQMPVMDGLTATREIRAWEQAKGAEPTPVIMLTANALPEHIDAGRAAGADGHLAKPIGAPALLTALLQIAESRPARRAA